jgi:hypothetical protein
MTEGNVSTEDKLSSDGEGEGGGSRARPLHTMELLAPLAEEPVRDSAGARMSQPTNIQAGVQGPQATCNAITTQ